MGINPATALRTWLRDNDVTVAALADRARVEESDLKEVLSGKPLTMSMADRLQRGTRIRAAVWMGMQRESDNDTGIAVAAQGTPKHVDWAGVVAILDEPSVDGLELAAPVCGLRTRALPLPVYVGSWPVGGLEEVRVDDSLVLGRGWLVMEALRASAGPQLATVLESGKHVPTYVSVDYAIVSQRRGDDHGLVKVHEDWVLKSLSLTVAHMTWPQARIALVHPQAELW